MEDTIFTIRRASIDGKKVSYKSYESFRRLKVEEGFTDKLEESQLPVQLTIKETGENITVFAQDLDIRI